MYSALHGDGSKALDHMENSPRRAAAAKEGCEERTTRTRETSPTVKVIQQMIAQKERELSDLHTTIS